MRFWLSLVAVCLASQAFAGEAGVMVLGAGQRSCGQFIAAVGQGPVGAVMQVPAPNGGKYYAELIRYHEWMMGFVTGYNAAYEDNTDNQIRIDMSALDLWMRRWCNDNPTKTVSQGAQVFRDQMAPQK
jgi:hypothetical protein